MLFGGYVQGAVRRARTPREAEARQLMLKAIELGWAGKDHEAFQQVWPMLLQPVSTLERLRSLAELQSLSSSSSNAVDLFRAAHQIDISEAAPRVRCPTLVLHPKRDRASPFEQGRLLASLIPGAKLVSLDSANHVLTELEPAWPEFLHELREFLPSAKRGAERNRALGDLTSREIEVLERIAQGLDNAQIAAHLDLSEKTVRNHITRIFDKLSVENRGQAIVRAREAGLGLRGAAA